LPASLRSENRSPSARNAVRVPSGISVRLRRNPHYSSQYGGTANIIRLIGNHFEDPNTGQTPYYFFAGQPGQNSVGGLVVESIGNDYMQDISTTQSAVLNGADFFSTGDTVEVNAPVTEPMTSFVVNQDADDIVSWTDEYRR
jgi:hypothetical protein